MIRTLTPLIRAYKAQQEHRPSLLGGGGTGSVKAAWALYRSQPGGKQVATHAAPLPKTHAADRRHRPLRGRCQRNGSLG